MELFDSHSHYNDEAFINDLDEVIKYDKENNLKYTIVAGYNYEGSIKAIEIANKYDHLFATVGISPNDIEDVNINKIENLAKNKKVVAIGEIGLDYHYDKTLANKQKEYFIKQIDIANRLNLPIVIHSRDAYKDTIEILRENKVNKKGVFHCTQHNRELIKDALELGFFISLSGNITYKNAKSADDCINLIPNDRLLIETDSPYMSPEPLRGTRNVPSNVKLVAEKIAKVKNMSIEEVSKLTMENTKRIFEICE